MAKKPTLSWVFLTTSRTTAMLSVFCSYQHHRLKSEVSPELVDSVHHNSKRPKTGIFVYLTFFCLTVRCYL